MLTVSLDTTYVQDLTLPFTGFVQNNNDSNAMILEFWALNNDTQNAVRETHMLTVTTAAD